MYPYIHSTDVDKYIHINTWQHHMCNALKTFFKAFLSIERMSVESEQEILVSTIP